MGVIARAVVAFLAFLAALPAWGTFHLWTMNELYSNADGSVQFLELTALTGGQEFMAGHTLQATGGGSTRSFTFPNNLPGDSGGKRMLVATQGFAALGIVTPNYIVPNGFFTPGGGSINFAESADLWTYGPLPGGSQSLNRDGSTGSASPQNFAGATGTLGGSTPTPVATFNVQALWWRSPALSEIGWGINIVHQGNTLFATWFTNDADGTDLWLFMDNMTLTANNTYSGNVFRANGSPFGLVPYDSTRFAPTQVGNATNAFANANNGSITYTVNGVTQTKAITKFIYSDPVPTCAAAGANPYTGAASYQDLWWRSPARSENGTGVNIIHQGNILFVTWFTYDTDGTGMWLFMDNAARTANRTYAGAVLQARGSPVNLIPFDASRFSASGVGTGTITFTDDNTGTFSYTVKGVTETKPIIRFVYSATLTSCTFETMDNNGMYPPDPY